MLLVVGLLVAAAIYLSSTTGGPSTRDFVGNAQQTLDELRDLIQSNIK